MVHISRSSAVAGLAAVLLAAAIPAASAAVSGPAARSGTAEAAAPGTIRPHGTVTSTVWGGYEATGTRNQYESVSASWVQPWVICSTGADAATWVGLDGATSGDPGSEQAGVEAQCSGTAASYFAFYELPDCATVDVGSVLPDDEISASVTSDAADYYTFDLHDVTQNWDRNYQVVATTSPLDESAEAIVSAGPTSTGPLADYGFQGFSNLTINGDANPSAQNAQQVDLINQNAVDEYTSPVTASGSFSVSYGIDEVAAKPLISFQTRSPQNQLVDNWSSLGQESLGQTILRNTSPSLALMPDGGFEEAIMTAYKTLVIVGTDLTVNTGLPVAGGASPVIAVDSSGTLEVAFEHSDGQLWLYTVAGGGQNQGRSMVGSSTPAITVVPGGFEVAYTAGNGVLTEFGAAGSFNSGSVLVRGGTNPGIAALATGGFESVFEDGAGYLVEGTTSGFTVTPDVMAGATNPAVTGLAGGGYEIAYVDNSLQLRLVGSIPESVSETVLTNTAPAIAAVGGSFMAVYENGSSDMVQWSPGNGDVVQLYAEMAGTSTYPAIAD